MILYNLLFQVCLALYGPDIPMARNPLDKIRRKEIFDIVVPYTMSREDVEIFEATPERLQDLWLESFTASLKGILYTSLKKLTKDEFSKCFPSHGASPAQIHGAAVGILSGQSILDRCKLKLIPLCSVRLLISGFAQVEKAQWGAPIPTFDSCTLLTPRGFD